MFKTVAKDVWAFDVEWVPDADAGRRLHQLPQDVEEAEVFEAMWKAGGATEEAVSYTHLTLPTKRIV